MIRRNIAQFRYFGSHTIEYEEIIIEDAIAERHFEDSPWNTYVETEEGSGIYIPLIEANITDPTTTQTLWRPKSGQRQNYPYHLTKEALASGEIFNKFTPIIKLGIQGIPGTKFRLNANLDWIILGATGLYEIDLQNSSGLITSLSFDPSSLELVDNRKNGYLIVDILYEEEV